MGSSGTVESYPVSFDTPTNVHIVFRILSGPPKTATGVYVAFNSVKASKDISLSDFAGKNPLDLLPNYDLDSMWEHSSTQEFNLNVTSGTIYLTIFNLDIWERMVDEVVYEV